MGASAGFERRCFSYSGIIASDEANCAPQVWTQILSASPQATAVEFAG